MIKAVLFDYGGVLSPGGKSFVASLSEILKVPPEDVKVSQVGIQLWNGEITPEEFFKELSELNGQPITVEKMLEVSGVMTKNQAVYDLAVELRQRGIKTAILSNMYKSTADLLRQQGYYDDFDPIVLSFEEKLAKPDRAVYQHTIEKIGLPAEEILFIDDQDRFLAPATEMGMQVIKAEDQQQIVADVKAILLKENNLHL